MLLFLTLDSAQTLVIPCPCVQALLLSLCTQALPCQLSLGLATSLLSCPFPCSLGSLVATLLPSPHLLFCPSIRQSMMMQPVCCQPGGQPRNQLTFCGVPRALAFQPCYPHHSTVSQSPWLQYQVLQTAATSPPSSPAPSPTYICARVTGTAVTVPPWEFWPFTPTPKIHCKII